MEFVSLSWTAFPPKVNCSLFLVGWKAPNKLTNICTQHAWKSTLLIVLLSLYSFVNMISDWAKRHSILYIQNQSKETIFKTSHNTSWKVGWTIRSTADHFCELLCCHWNSFHVKDGIYPKSVSLQIFLQAWTILKSSNPALPFSQMTGFLHEAEFKYCHAGRWSTKIVWKLSFQIKQ